MYPLVSVIMATLNTDKKYLITAIKSILDQTYKNLELIIVIDGGNDAEIINNYFHDSRIKLIIHNQTKGLPYSLNEAIKIAKGKYIMRMDSDDISLASRIEKQVNYMEKYQNIDILATYYQQFGESNKKIKEKFINSTDVKCKLFFVNCIAHPSVMFRKESINTKNLFYNENYAFSQDYELWTRYPNVNIEILPEICLLYRIHNKQVSTVKKDKQFELYKSILIRNLKKLDLVDSDIKYLLALNGKRRDISIAELYDFVVSAINKNDLYHYYDQVRFRKILLRQYSIYCIKCKNVLNLKFIKHIKYLFV